MRLGVLEFDISAEGVLESLLGPLRAHDVDVVAREATVITLDAAIREAKRLARADCDGILLMAGEGKGAAPLAAAAAALVSGVPLLLAGAPGNGGLFEAAGALDEIGAPFDRLIRNDGLASAEVETWLRANAKTERHRGLEAVRRLYGQRLYVPDTVAISVDRSLWLHQFGVIVTGEAEGAEFAALGGDVYGALTARLLELVSGTTPRDLVALGDLAYGSPAESGVMGTLARISHRAGRFRCLLLQGPVSTDGTRPLFTGIPSGLFAAAASPWLHVTAGEHLGAMRAACLALDIAPVILETAP
ncbi:MAG: hypothetical protein H7Z41_18510 [Cytophagales bacterium]|nr:hypothetical protein [Armatimonadota bacterium]